MFSKKLNRKRVEEAGSERDTANKKKDFKSAQELSSVNQFCTLNLNFFVDQHDKFSTFLIIHISDKEKKS